MYKTLFVTALALCSFSCNENKNSTETMNAVERIVPDLKPDRYNVAFLIMNGTYNT